MQMHPDTMTGHQAHAGQKIAAIHPDLTAAVIQAALLYLAGAAYSIRI